MPPAAPQSNQDNSMAMLWTIAAVMAAVAAIWMIFKTQIISFYFHLKIFEIDYGLKYFNHQLEDVKTVMQRRLSGDVSKITLDDLMLYGGIVGNYLRYPLVLITGVLAVLVYFSSNTRTYKRTYTMKTLAQLEKTNWPQITPVIHLDLAKQDIRKGPWAMSLSPMQFCKRYHLLQEFRRESQEGALRREGQIEVTLKRGEANRIFAMQLGQPWPGINRVKPHVRALFAAFAARINGDSKGAAALFAHVNISSATKLDFSPADALLKKYVDSPIVKQIMNSHGYLLTVMAEMLAAARSDGVQASADFLWLKPVDRRLWYMLNTVGRQTPFPEVAGPFAHWVAEKTAGRKLLLPMVEEATNALELALKEIVYRPDEGDE
ncbi:MAG: type IVB secretion system coupling complex protein DotM/IcmP [Gammaproteobacteria bacterium]|nr:type IVB secretion system coupling complex protein DotM/IcmP [Gammaproteobacteria bacterium]